MDFNQRLQKAAERGQKNRDLREREAAARAMSEEECRRLHSKYRLELTDHIESCLKQLSDYFPGFRPETIVGETGWGSAVSRDDVNVTKGRLRASHYSRLEMLVTPLGKYHVLNVAVKGTIRNKEVFNRTHYQLLGDVDIDAFCETIDLWALEYAELFAMQA
jgi:hypothetical protein